MTACSAPTSKYRLHAQRRIPGEGWQLCPPHLAQRWCVLRPGPTDIDRVAFTTARKCDAQAWLDRRLRLAAPSRSFSFGADCPTRLPIGQLLAQGAGMPRKL